MGGHSIICLPISGGVPYSILCLKLGKHAVERLRKKQKLNFEMTKKQKH